MARSILSLFGSTRALEGQIDTFLEKISEGGLVFQAGLNAFLAARLERAGERIEQLTALESEADALRRSIEMTLYTEMLIPESRGDVLNLLGDLDTLLDGFKASLLGIVVEQPEIPTIYHDRVRDLGAVVTEACEHTIRAARAFFRDVPSIRDHIHKISYFEAESDEIALRLNRSVFGSDIELSRKLHLRDTLRVICEIADAAEDCGDRLAIYAVKRSL